MVFDLLKGIILIAAGLYLVFIPYEKFKAIFPKAKLPFVVRVAGVIAALCGALVLVVMLLG